MGTKSWLIRTIPLFVVLGVLFGWHDWSDHKYLELIFGAVVIAVFEGDLLLRDLKEEQRQNKVLLERLEEGQRQHTLLLERLEEGQRLNTLLLERVGGDAGRRRHLYDPGVAGGQRGLCRRDTGQPELPGGGSEPDD